MCGIVGCVGLENARNYLVTGLEMLEYRGYDSAGVAVVNENEFNIIKDKGDVSNLKNQIPDFISRTGFGHTRWATHGKASRVNAHPHTSGNGQFAIIHNGIIENYKELYEKYLTNILPKSETDTEIVILLLEYFFSTGLNVQNSFVKTVSLLEGAYSLAVLDKSNPDVAYLAKKKSPLVIGLGEGYNLFASDVIPMSYMTNKFIRLNDDDIAIVKRESVEVLDFRGDIVERDIFYVNSLSEKSEKGEHSHFMLKEISEQPYVIDNILNEYVGENGEFLFNGDFYDRISSCDKVYIIGCGTSYNAGLLGKYYFEQIARTPSEVFIASEFNYNPPIITGKPLFIFLTQSGETADVINSVKSLKGVECYTLAITNTPNSTITAETQSTLYLHAGQEVSVASTKAYIAQVSLLGILASFFAERKRVICGKPFYRLLREVSVAQYKVIAEQSIFHDIAKKFFKNAPFTFFIGRGIDYLTIIEGELKLKEISYIFSQCLPGGELKHGALALIDNGTPVLTLITQANTASIMRSNLSEACARGGIPVVFSMSNLSLKSDAYSLPEIDSLVAPLISIIPLQLLAFYSALERGCNIDKPRNLAKSVTVE
jgi:glutamine---fructose-6-phosphate transaminase (isomerizing)